MPEQFSHPVQQTNSRAYGARRFMLSASLSALVAACCSAGAPIVLLAQSPAQPMRRATPPPSATARARPGKAKVVKSNEAAEKPAKVAAEKPATTAAAAAAAAAKPEGAAEITRARRAAATSAAAQPAAAPATAAANATTAPAAVASVSNEATAEGEEAELDKLRADLGAAGISTERARLQRALVARLVELKRDADALAQLRLMLGEDRYDPPFFFNTGNALARLGDASAAEDAYRKAISQRHGNYARALNNLGVVLIRQGHWDEARQTFAAALKQENYTYAEASYNLGRLHLLRGEADLALREWGRTLQLEPAHAEAAIALAHAYAEDGDAKRGLLVLDNFVARSTRSGGAAGVPREIVDARRELVAAANIKTGDGAGGDDGVRLSSSNSTPRRSHVVDRMTYDLLQTARGARERGDYAEAAKYYGSVLARSPGGYFPPANLELGSALMNLRREEEAIAALLPLTQKEAAPRYPVAYYYLGRLYERRGQLETAAQHFARAAELYGDANPQMLLDLSRVREQMGDHAAALAALDAYVKSIAQQGTVPAWAIERQAKLSQKISTNKATQNPRTKP
ncbi:MAG: tetratricopeptide repeat protein [Pyrinomonadaceae bacterium]